MAVTLIVGGASDATVEVGLSPLAELVAHLHALTEREHHEGSGVDPSGLPAELLDDVRMWSPLWAAYRARFLVPLAPPLGRSLAEELDAVARLPLSRFAELAGYAVRGGNTGPVLDRLLEDTGQQEPLRQAARYRSTARSELADRLLEAPQRFRDELLDFLARYAAARFDAEWARLRPRLVAEVHRMRIRMRDRGIAGSLAELSASARVLDEPRRVVFDKVRSLVARLDAGPNLVIPSRYVCPLVLIKNEAGLPLVIQYGTGTEARGEGEVSIAVLRARLRLLADPARIRLCRLIAREALTTTELSARSGMGEPQVSRYLRQLREAELVMTERAGRMVLYRLDLTTVRALGTDLEFALFR